MYIVNRGLAFIYCRSHNGWTNRRGGGMVISLSVNKCTTPERIEQRKGFKTQYMNIPPISRLIGGNPCELEWEKFKESLR